MKIPSLSIGALPQPTGAEARRPRDAQSRGALPGGRAEIDDAFAAARDYGRRRAGDADFISVQRVGAAAENGGPGRSAVSAYLSVARHSLPAAWEGELVGIDIVV